ncbi:hypothetical protein [Micromonospora aurantiaca (nom. illeg.)]|uniref:hypothetical protein n=1 Tax=Micromonospora aurantiaca (nom. illeg.) TaxID=47850 RepID=UPI0016573B5D|nr:hypothetical protein [Micromonospora aurantiaca]MBC9004099.1 hypothetical protein [Micromonospora aurantiaca]
MSRVDLSWIPAEPDRLRLVDRLERLYKSSMEVSVGDAMRNLRTLARTAPEATIRINDGVRVRNGFVCLTAPAEGSDRRGLAAADRPPATRIMGRKGVALRLLLTALFEVQTRTNERKQAGPNTRPLSHAGAGQIAWTDLFASGAEDALDGQTAMTRQDKHRRHLATALGALGRHGLVTFPHWDDARNKQRGFELLVEHGQPGSNVPYTVPAYQDANTFVLPTGLFTRGWISVLTDAELAFLLMAAFMHKRDPEGFILPAGVRSRMLGIGPETYEAHRTLQAFGLVRVTHQRGRSPNGRLAQIAGGGQQPLPDMVQFLPEGLDQEAYGTVTEAIDRLVYH